MPDAAVDARFRAASTQRPPWCRLRDHALLARLIYAGVRRQEAVAVQIRDRDLAAGTLTVRRGTGGKACRLLRHPAAQRRLAVYLQKLRGPLGLPALGSAAAGNPSWSA